MKLAELIQKYVSLRLLATLGIFFSIAWSSKADTPVYGNISGTWSPIGNDYIVVDTCTVPSGGTLTIEPGVIVQIGSNVTINVNGMIQAVGNSTDKITFGPTGINPWNTINVISSADTHQFKFCDFQYANTAITMNSPTKNCDIYYCTFQNVGDGVDMFVRNYGYSNMASKIMNCTFSNCASRAIYGQSYGIAYAFVAYDQNLNVVVKNCIFNGNGNGCVFNILGQSYDWLVGRGYANLQIVGNIFYSTTNAAIYMDVGNWAAGASSAIVINNTIVNAGYGIRVQDPWNAKVQSCILTGCTNAMVAVGSLSRVVSYNDFYGNATNFVGYPSDIYGNLTKTNRNGTPSDLLYNILSDPQFVAAEDFHLATNSPCIDAGAPDWAYTDMCFPPSQGSDFPDMGAYGGPDACNWLDEVPLLPTTLAITRADQMITLNWGAIPRSEYQVQFATNLLTVGTNWLDCTNGWVLAVDKPTFWAVAETNFSQMFFRVLSLGRTFGN